MPTSAPKRKNLTARERSKAIVRAAAEMVEKDGWDKLNMSTLAKRTNITRQLIYLHYPSVEELMIATATYLFQTTYLDTLTAAGQFQEHGVAGVLTNAQNVTMDLPPGRARALLKIISTAFSEDSEMSHFARRMRHLITNIWSPAVAEAFQLEAKEAKSVAWLLVMAFWGGYQLMDDGDLSKEEAIERLNWLGTAIYKGSQGREKQSATSLIKGK
jgi:AcrR family transcriptional regulator